MQNGVFAALRDYLIVSNHCSFAAAHHALLSHRDDGGGTCHHQISDDEPVPIQRSSRSPDTPTTVYQGGLGTMSLTRHREQADSPVRRFFEERFGNVTGIQRCYREGAGPLRVPGSGANPGTVGGAADWLMRFLVHPTPDVHLAFAGAANYMGEKMLAAAVDIATRLGTTPDPLNSAWVPSRTDQSLLVAAGSFLGGLDDAHFVPTGQLGPTPTFAGPVAGATVEPDLLARGCWALALLTEAFRAGSVVLRYGPLSQFVTLHPGGFPVVTDVTADDLLGLAPQPTIEELHAIREVMEASLLPPLRARLGPWALGPTFTGSGAVGGADADLIASGLLVELKTTLGRKRSDGGRTCTLDKLELFQILAYSLLDLDDRYRLMEVALFNARYGYLASWALDGLVRELSGGALDISAARAEFTLVLESPLQ